MIGDTTTYDKKTHIISVIVLIIVVALLCSDVHNIRQLRLARKESERLRTELDNQGLVNRQLAENLKSMSDGLGECQEIAGRIGELSVKDTGTIRDSINLVREIRKEVEDLANCFNRINVDSTSVYNNNGGASE